MELKKGYKQTELGVIPSDWEVDDIGNLVAITTGAKNTQDRIEDGNYPFFVRSQTIERINSYSFDGEGILTAGDGVGTGKVFHYIKGKFDFHQRVYLMSGFANHLNGYFFYLYFKNNFYNRIMQMTAKSSVDSVRREMISKMKLLLPSIKEQTAIATALSDADALITSLEKLITKKRNIKQGAMQQLLKPKKGWVLKELGEVIEFQGGSQPPLTTFISVPKQGYIRLLQIRDYKTDKYETYIPRNLARKFCDKEDIMIGRYGPPIFQILRGLEGAYNVALIKAIPSELINRDYAYYFLTQNSLFNFVEKLSQRSSGQTGVDLQQLRIYPLPLPNLNEQKEIVNILSDLDNEIYRLEIRLEKYRNLKQGMMQNLLTGKIRLQ